MNLQQTISLQALCNACAPNSHLTVTAKIQSAALDFRADHQLGYPATKKAEKRYNAGDLKITNNWVVESVKQSKDP